MTNNPLAIRSVQNKTYDLAEFVAEANRNWFVIDSGKPYFVNKRIIGGVERKFMDRHA